MLKKTHLSIDEYRYQGPSTGIEFGEEVSRSIVFITMTKVNVIIRFFKPSYVLGLS